MRDKKAIINLTLENYLQIVVALGQANGALQALSLSMELTTGQQAGIDGIIDGLNGAGEVLSEAIQGVEE